MSHFYPRKSYSFAETDEMMVNIKKEMSNFLTKEEAMDIIGRRGVIIDPPPFYDYHKVDQLHERIHDLERKLSCVFIEIDKLKNQKKNTSSP
jgi:hypothetical protein